jgi:hypothetical protein
MLEEKRKAHVARVRKLAKSAGYSTGKQNHSMKGIMEHIAEEKVHEHEKEYHGVKKAHSKQGGVVDGIKTKGHLGKMKRGGAAKKGATHVHVNVISAPKPELPPALALPAGAPSPSPMPMGAPTGQMKKGGIAKGVSKVEMEYGANNGKGRKEKAELYGKK